METLLFTFYVLMWPALSAGTLVVLVVAFGRDVLQAKREGKGGNLV